MDLTGYFTAAHKNEPFVPLDQRDTVQIKHDGVLESTYRGLGLGERFATNFNYILKTGQVPENNKLAALSVPNHTIDWKAHDAFTDAMKTIEQRTNETIKTSPDLQVLLHKSNWNKQDREAWEEGVSNIVSQETSKIPSLGSYRVKDGTASLNELSKDITGHSKTVELDCQGLSIIKGSIMQKVENSMLPKTAGPSDFKKASSYFLVPGGVSGPNFKHENKFIDHEYIVTPAGNVIEATVTSNANAYRKSLGNTSQEDLILRNKPLVSSNDSVYGGYEEGTAARERMRQEAWAVHNGVREQSRKPDSGPAPTAGSPSPVTALAAVTPPAQVHSPNPASIKTSDSASPPPHNGAGPGPSPEEVRKIQTGLQKTGLYDGPANGQWNEKTNQAMETLIVRAQMSPVYKQAGGEIDGVYGQKTGQAFNAMAAKGQMDADLARTIRDVNTKGELHEVYAPADTGGTIRAIRQNPDTMAKISEVTPTAAAQPGPRPLPAAQRTMAASMAQP